MHLPLIRNFYSNIFTRSLCLIFAVVFGAFTSSKSLALPWNDMNKLGESTLSVAFWDIYDATLYSADTRFDSTKPFALKLTYLRDFKKKNLVKETKKQLKELKLFDHRNNEQWLQNLSDIWVDVKKGDSITFYSDINGAAAFYYNDTYLGNIQDPEFTKRFAAIWLSELTSQPEMRLELLGLR